MAGTTGALSGVVLEAGTNNPVAGARVTAAGPVQTATAVTDARGHFILVSLSPDTYTLSVQREGYEANSVTGVTVLADQTQNLSFAMRKSVRVIGQVTVRSSLDAVKPGTTTDVYSVTPAVAGAAAPLGGGGGLTNAYSAIAAMPGAYVPNGQMGVNQTVYIRGGYYDQIGYEYDGVPVNRSFDNYPGHSASTLGQQELQIYTSGGDANTNATGLAGFINQVVRAGSYPGFTDVSARVGAPTFYHDLSVEAGGATPSRLFSYYAGLSGFNPDFRYFDQKNGSDLMNLFPYATGPSNLTTNLSFYPAVYPTCNADLSAPSNPGLFTNDPGCFSAFNPVYDYISLIRGREAVANFHFGIPHRSDAGRDDVQLLYTSSAQYRQYYSGVEDAGTNLVYGAVNAGIINPPHWPDYLTYPAGTPFLAPADVQPIAYLFPGSPTDRCANTDPRVPVPGACPSGVTAALPPDYRDARWDTASIVKAQYQKNFGSNAYLRIFGYSFYSNTNRSGASRRGIGSGFGATNFDYEVNSHTRGAQAQFADQVSDKHQIVAMVNYVTATTVRYNNFNYLNGRNQQVSNLTNGSQCFAYTSTSADNGIDSFNAGDPAPCNDSSSQGTFRYPTEGQGLNPCTTGDVLVTSAACLAGASWRLTYTGNQAGLNKVRPAFTSAALTDHWQPTDKLNVQLGLRWERDQFNLSNTNTPGKNFWFAAAQREYCYNPVTLLPVLVPQAPQNASTINPYVTFNCPVDTSTGTPVQTVHPDGSNGHLLLSNQYDPTYTQTYVEPRVGMTYTVNQDTVLRLSAGRYAQQPQNYEVQYDSVDENLAAQLIGFLPFGFTTPRHDARAQFSNNYDFSYERHFPGTDMSLKLTPYYRYATDQLYGVNVPTLLLSPSLNTGTEKNSGLELQLTKGDFNKQGWSGVFSYTYLNSKERFNNFQNSTINPVDPYNQYIQNFNALTQAGGGAACYANSADDTPDPTCGPASIRNPYYAQAPQPLFAKNGWYDTGLNYPYLSPNVFSVIVNHRSGKLALTPAVSLNEGATYGNPADVIGIDPRTCSANNANIGATSGDPLNADYTSCSFAATPSGSLYIPNPESGHFDRFGEYRQPWQFNLGAQVTYDLRSDLKANLTVANLLNRCFGGSSTFWTKQYAPSSTVCGYASNTFYISNFYNGASPNDAATNGAPLNPYFTQSFVPSYGDVNSFNYPLPLQLYFQLQWKTR